MHHDGSDAHPLPMNPYARPDLWLLELPAGEPVLLAEVSTAPTWLP